MPFYEYECKACGAQTEVLQKISDKPLRKCPECGKSALIKLVSAPIFRLKGGGWYETDFKSEQDKKRNLAGDDKDAKPETKAESKAEAKPDTKAEAKSEPKAESKPDTKSSAKTTSKTAPSRSSARKSTGSKARKGK